MFTSRMDKLAAAALCLAGLVTMAGCSKAPDDGQIVQSIRAQMQKDSAVHGDVKVESLNGTVTLTGQVSSEAERLLAAREAAAAPGVKAVINNLTVGAEATDSGAAPPVVKPSPAPRVARNEEPRHRARSHHAEAAPPEENTVAANTPPPPVVTPTPAPEPAVAAPPAPVAPPPPPAPVKYTIPAGTAISVRLIDSLDSGQNKVGDTFRATLNTPLRADGEVVIPAGVNVEGRVVDASNAGRFSGHSELKLELTKLTSHGSVYPLQTQTYDRADQGRGKGTAETVGGGAAIGAIIGAIAGGGRGAAIGTIAGAGAGGAARGVKSAPRVVLPSETVLSFQLQEPLTVINRKGTSPESRKPMAP